MEVLAKLKSSKGKKGAQTEQPPSKEEIINAMENYSADRSPANKESNNNSKPLSRGSSGDNKWEFVDFDHVSTPASLSHSYSLEWENLFNKPDMMKKLKAKAMEGHLRSSRFRSVIWKLFLEVLPPKMDNWLHKTRKSRNIFEELKNRLIVNPRKAVDSVDITLNNPLSQDEESPWNKFFQDNELRLTIKQDVIRTFPEVEFFRSSQMNELMIEILFCFCREHASHSYKQGMHELLAPLIFILHCDHQAFLHACEIETVLSVMKEVMDPAFLEHDAYTMFCQVMETVEPWYLSRDMFYSQTKSGSMRNLELITATPFSKSQDLNPSSAIVTKLTRIQDYILKKFDPELHQYLERLEIVPQIYGIRWLRLLFGREFPMQDLLMLWDAIFGDGIGFDLVDYIFVAMLLYIRDSLVTSDYATCLTALMKYPAVPDVHYFVVKALWLREPNQFPRPPNYTHQGSIRTNSMGSNDDINNLGSGGGSSRDTGKNHANNPIGSTVSLSHVEESMFRHNPSASSLTRMESSNLRSAQSSPGIHHSTMFPLTPDDSSVTSSPTRYNTLPGKGKNKNKKLTKLEKEMQEKISHLQGDLNDKKFMCKYCASKLDVHVGRLQQELTRQNIEVDDDIMLSLAGLKLVRDILNGTLKFTQTIVDDDDEIQINDDYYGNLEGGAESSTGVTSPDSDILLGAASSGLDEARFSKQQKHKLFYMSSEEAISPESVPSESLTSARFRGSNTVELNDVYEASDATADSNLDTAGERKSAGNVGSAGSVKDISSSTQFTAKIRRMFKGSSSQDPQLRQSPVQTSDLKSTSVADTGLPLAEYRLCDDDRLNDSKAFHSINQDGAKALGIRRHSKDGQLDRDLASVDTRWKTKCNVENPSHWSVYSPLERRSSRASLSGHSDEEGRAERVRQVDEEKSRGRSKSQPSAFTGSAFHPLYNAKAEEDHKVNPLYKMRYQQDMEH